MKQNDFTGKNYLIAGASSGIGNRIAHQLLDNGAKLIVLGRKTPQDLIDRGAIFQSHDFSSGSVVETSNWPDVIDGLAYCPGTINLKPFGRFSLDDFRADFEVNVLGAVSLLQMSHKYLRKAEQPSIVLFSTVAAKLGMGFHASIAASKGAIEGLGKTLAAEWAPQKIRVNVLAPSLTDTPLAGQLLATEEKREASNKRHPIGRVGTADDLANAATWLLGPASTWVTGQVIAVDGGMGALK